MTDNEIIKTWEKCANPANDCYGDDYTCEYCKYDKGTGECFKQLRKDVTDLINRQKAEIERLNANYEKLQLKYENGVNDNKFLKRQNKNAKSEAIKDVLLTLETAVEESSKYIREYDDSKEQKAYNKAFRDAYNLVKEMEGE